MGLLYFVVPERDGILERSNLEDELKACRGLLHHLIRKHPGDRVFSNPSENMDVIVELSFYSDETRQPESDVLNLLRRLRFIVFRG